MASITKVMTALRGDPAGDLSRMIRISPDVASYVERARRSSAGLPPGTSSPRASCSRACSCLRQRRRLALAGAYRPGSRAFVRKMNATARALGIRNTHFANFDGLPWPTDYTTYSTPRDLIILGRAA